MNERPMERATMGTSRAFTSACVRVFKEVVEPIVYRELGREAGYAFLNSTSVSFDAGRDGRPLPRLKRRAVTIHDRLRRMGERERAWRLEALQAKYGRLPS